MANGEIRVSGDRISTAELLERAQVLAEQRQSDRVQAHVPSTTPAQTPTSSSLRESENVARPVAPQPSSDDDFSDRFQRLTEQRAPAPTATVPQQSPMLPQGVAQQAIADTGTTPERSIERQKEREQGLQEMRNLGIPVPGEKPVPEEQPRSTPAQQQPSQGSPSSNSETKGGLSAAVSTFKGEDGDSKKATEAIQKAGGRKLAWSDIPIVYLGWVALSVVGVTMPPKEIKMFVAYIKNFRPSTYSIIKIAVYLVISLTIFINLILPILVFMTIIQVGASAACIPGLGYISNVIVKGLCN